MTTLKAWAHKLWVKWFVLLLWVWLAAVQRTVQWNRFINKEQIVSFLSLTQSGWSGWPGYRCHVRRHVTRLFPPPHIIRSPSLSLFLFVLLSVYCFTCILALSCSVWYIYILTGLHFPPLTVLWFEFQESGEEINNNREIKNWINEKI